jgi:hypothetical protein
MDTNPTSKSTISNQTPSSRYQRKLRLAVPTTFSRLEGIARSSCPGGAGFRVRSVKLNAAKDTLQAIDHAL